MQKVKQPPIINEGNKRLLLQRVQEMESCCIQSVPRTMSWTVDLNISPQPRLLQVRFPSFSHLEQTHKGVGEKASWVWEFRYLLR